MEASQILTLAGALLCLVVLISPTRRRLQLLWYRMRLRHPGRWPMGVTRQIKRDWRIQQIAGRAMDLGLDGVVSRLARRHSMPMHLTRNLLRERDPEALEQSRKAWAENQKEIEAAHRRRAERARLQIQNPRTTPGPRVCPKAPVVVHIVPGKQ